MNRSAQFESLVKAGRAAKFAAYRQPDQVRRSSGLLESAELYRRAFEATDAHSTYALINAATLSLLGGDPAGAHVKARQVLAMLESGRHEADTLYWLAATRAEALLVLGRDHDAAQSLRAAMSLAPRAWEEHAITLRQFEFLLSETGRRTDWLEAMRPPPVLVFGGTMGLAPDDEAAAMRLGGVVTQLAPGEAYGALAAGTDIIVAEAVLAAGADLHVILPASIETFRQASVLSVGSPWVARFDACLEAASSLEVTGSNGDGPGAEAPFALELAMGHAIARTQQLENRAVGIHAVAETPGGEALADLWSRWEGHGFSFTRIELDRSAPSPVGNGDVRPTRAALAFGGSVEMFDTLETALAYASEVEGRVGLAYGSHGPLALLATALAEADGGPGIRASEHAALAARLVDPEIESELAGGVHFEGGMADLHRLYLPQSGKA